MGKNKAHEFVKMILAMSYEELLDFLREIFIRQYEIEAAEAERQRFSKCPNCERKGEHGVLYKSNKERIINCLGLEKPYLTRFSLTCGTCKKRFTLPSKNYAYNVRGQLIVHILIAFHKNHCSDDPEMLKAGDSPHIQAVLMEAIIQLNGDVVDYVVKNFWEKLGDDPSAKVEITHIKGNYEINKEDSQPTEIKEESEITHEYRQPFVLLRALTNNFKHCILGAIDNLADLIGRITCPWQIIDDHGGTRSPFRWIGGFTKKI